MMKSIISVLFLAATTTTTAFAPTFRLPQAVATTRLYIDQRTADMVDQEYYRQTHRKEYENAWMQQNRNAIFQQQQLENMAPADVLPDGDEVRQKVKDRKLAAADPARYCADRCVSTGNCEVYEDFFDFSPDEVMEFCNDCVLSESEEPCEVPEAFFDDDFATKLRP